MLQMLAAAAPAIGMGIASAVPGKMEKMYRNEIKADQKRLAGGAGGMSQGKLQQAQANVMGAAQAQQQAQLAQLARGSAQGAGAAGQTQQMMNQAIKQTGQNVNQGMSQIREQDLAIAEAQRQGLQNRMLQAREMGQQRKNQAMQYFQSIPSSMGGAMGQAQRGLQTQNLAGAAPAIGGK